MKKKKKKKQNKTTKQTEGEKTFNSLDQTQLFNRWAENARRKRNNTDVRWRRSICHVLTRPMFCCIVALE